METTAAEAPSTPQEQDLRVTDVVVREFLNITYDGRNGQPQTWVYSQDQLTFFEKAEFTRLLANALDYVLQGGMTIAELVSSLDIDDDTADRMRRGDIDVTMIPAATSLFNLIVKIASAVPSFLEDAYFVALGVPPKERDGFRASLGAIDDETGFAILELFVEQNAEAMVGFFERLWKVAKLGQKTMGLGLPKMKRASVSSPTSSD